MLFIDTKRIRYTGRTVAALLCGVVLWGVGCRTLEQIAPPADDQLALRSGLERAVLGRGRMIYITKCAACHVVEPVNDYSAAQWNTILPEMAKESRLSVAQTAEVKAYIDACLAAPGVQQ